MKSVTGAAGYFLQEIQMKRNILFEIDQNEKRLLDIAKAKSDYETWKDFFISLVESQENDE